MRHGIGAAGALVTLAALAATGCVGDSGPNTPPTNDAAVDVAKEAAVDAGPFTPKALPGLLFWMVASRGVTTSGAGVSKWEDQSGLKNDASQADVSRQPKLVANAIAGHAALEYPGGAVQTDIDNGSPTKGFTGDFFVELVASSTLPAGETGTVFVAGNPSGDNAQILVEQAKFEAGLFIGIASKFVVMPNPFTPGVAHVVFFRRAGTKFEVGVDGTAISVPDAPAGAIPSLFRFGGPFKGLLAEVVGVDGVISTADQAALESYLKAKYAL